MDGGLAGDVFSYGGLCRERETEAKDGDSTVV